MIARPNLHENTALAAGLKAPPAPYRRMAPQFLEREAPFTLIPDDVLEVMPASPCAVNGIYHQGALVVLVGAPGSGKTFLVLDLALSLATGQSWHGREVSRGTVVYVAAEGRVGLGARIGAWKAHHGVAGRLGLLAILEPTVLGEPRQVDRLLASVERLPKPPVAFIFDTLARNLGDADENSARDMGRFIQGADHIRRETGAATIVVHHTGLKGGRERGSTALRGAADTTLLVRGNKSGQVDLQCLKQKEAAPFKNLSFQLRECAGSCVLVPNSVNASASPAQHLTAPEQAAFDFLAQRGPIGATYSEWERGSGIKGGAFNRAKDALVNACLVHGGGGKGVPYRIV
jgi:hypothetical protein